MDILEIIEDLKKVNDFLRRGDLEEAENIENELRTNFIKFIASTNNEFSDKAKLVLASGERDI